MLYGIINNGYTYYYVRDILGNILGLVDTNGIYVIKYTYDAFGNVISITGTLKDTLGQDNPYLYKGYYYDFETLMYYCKSRYYIPLWGRWLNADDVDYLDPESIIGLNLFAYCNNNPVMCLLWTKGLGGNSVGNSAMASGGGLIEYKPSESNWWKNNTYSKIRGTWFFHEGVGRFEWKLPKDKTGTFKVGLFEKFSIYNLQGQAGFGSSGNNFIGVKGVADFGTVTGLVGVIINPQDQTCFAGIDVGAAVATGRVGITLGNNVEVGVWGEALALKGTVGIGFYKGEFTFKAGASVLLGGGVYIRIQLW